MTFKPSFTKEEIEESLKDNPNAPRNFLLRELIDCYEEIERLINEQSNKI